MGFHCRPVSGAQVKNLGSPNVSDTWVRQALAAADCLVISISRSKMAPSTSDSLCGGYVEDQNLSRNVKPGQGLTVHET